MNFIFFANTPTPSFLVQHITGKHKLGSPVINMQLVLAGKDAYKIVASPLQGPVVLALLLLVYVWPQHETETCIGDARVVFF